MKWKDHLYAMDHLRESIGYRAYGQQDPLVEYQHEAYEMFKGMIQTIRSEVVEMIFRIQVMRPEEQTRRIMRPTQFLHPEASSPIAETPASSGPLRGAPPEVEEGPPPVRPPFRGPRPGIGRGAPQAPPQPVKHDQPKVGRNDPCPCGSGKKYKKCHGISE